MRFYENQHQFYIGIDLHARSMYVCVVNNSGETVFHKNMACSRENPELVTDTFGKDSEVYRNTIPDKFSDPATLQMVNADLAMFKSYNFLLQAWHGYRFTFTQGRSAFLADTASLASLFPKMSSCRKSVFRFAVTDYMCLRQDAFPGIFF